jgi:hypothetical protein
VKVSSSDGGRVLRTLVDANVQFVVVGEPEGAGALRLVVSRHPTNLEALGRALDSLGSSLRTLPESSAPGLHRIGDPAGTVAVQTVDGDVDLVFGGPHRSLYAEALERAQQREIGGTTVQWSEELAPIEPPGRVTSRVLTRRLLSIAEGLAQLLDRHDERSEPGSGVTVEDSGTTGGHPPAG